MLMASCMYFSLYYLGSMFRAIYSYLHLPTWFSMSDLLVCPQRMPRKRGITHFGILVWYLQKQAKDLLFLHEKKHFRI